MAQRKTKAYRMSLKFDENTARKLDAVYQTRDAKKRRQAVLEALNVQPGERVLDIGTGLGHLAMDMADQIGSNGAIAGLDLNEAMLGIARQRCADKPWIEFTAGDAAQLPFPDASFDAAVSVQVYEYIKDTEQVLKELHRILKPGGRAAIVATDWKSTLWHSSDPDRMDKVLTAWEEHCAHSDLPRVLEPQLQQAGFTVQAQQVVPQFNSTFSANTYSYHILGFIKPFAQGKNRVSAEEAEAWAQDLMRLGETGEYFFCLNQFLFLVGK